MPKKEECNLGLAIITREINDRSIIQQAHDKNWDEVFRILESTDYSTLHPNSEDRDDLCGELLHIAVKYKVPNIIEQIRIANKSQKSIDYCVNFKTPIQQAADKGYWECVTVIANSIQANESDDAGYGYALLQASKSSDENAGAAALVLISQGALSSGFFTTESFKILPYLLLRLNALHHAIINDKLPLIMELRKGKYPRWPKSNRHGYEMGISPMAVAIILEKTRYIELLKEEHFKLETYDKPTITCIAQEKKWDVVTRLLHHVGRDLFDHKFYETLIQLAVDNQQPDIIKLILSVSEESIADKVNDKTAIQRSADKGYWDCVAAIATSVKTDQYDIANYSYALLMTADFPSNKSNSAFTVLIEANTPRIAYDIVNDSLKRINDFIDSPSSELKRLMRLFKKVLENNYRSLWYDTPLKDIVKLGSVIKVFTNPDNHADIYQVIRLMCMIRSEIIAGTPEDFFIDPSILNQVYFQMAKILASHVHCSPLEILYEQEVHEFHDKSSQRWYDIYTGEGALPDSPELIIRHRDARSISLLSNVLDRAKGRLLENYSPWEEVFLINDPRRQDLQDIHIESPIIEFLRKHSRSFNTLFLHADNKQCLYTKNFSDLREGLLKGDVDHDGQERNAAPPANTALVEFFKWWNTVPHDNKNKINAVSVANASETWNTIGKILAILANPRQHMDKITTCIQIIGGHIQSALLEGNPLLSQIDESYILSADALEKLIDNSKNELTAALSNRYALSIDESRSALSAAYSPLSAPPNNKKLREESIIKDKLFKTIKSIKTLSSLNEFNNEFNKEFTFINYDGLKQKYLKGKGQDDALTEGTTWGEIHTLWEKNSVFLRSNEGRSISVEFAMKCIRDYKSHHWISYNKPKEIIALDELVSRKQEEDGSVIYACEIKEVIEKANSKHKAPRLRLFNEPEYHPENRTGTTDVLICLITALN